MAVEIINWIKTISQVERTTKSLTLWQMWTDGDSILPSSKGKGETNQKKNKTQFLHFLI